MGNTDAPRHVLPILGGDLTQHAHRRQARQLCQVHSGLCVPPSLKHASRLDTTQPPQEQTHEYDWQPRNGVA